jgi:uncharacterized protein
MKPSIALNSHRYEIRAIIEKHNTQNVRVFGSVAQGTDVEGSDLDLLVEPTSLTTLMDLGRIRAELLELLNVNVDVLTPQSLPDSFRDKVLGNAQSV